MDGLVQTSKHLAATLCRTGETYEEAAQRIEVYDTVAYPIPAVFMSPVVAAFLRALAAADGADAPATEPAYSHPSYGPALRESGA